jgi:hypothetical protein
MKIGIEFMKIKTHQITGDLYILSDTQYNDVLADNVFVKENIVTRLYGGVSKDLHVGKGAIVYLHGKIKGQIKNNGGTIYIFEADGNVKTVV